VRFIASALCLLLATNLGCTKAGSATDDDGAGVAPRPQPQPQPQGDVIVELSGVTLGDDCGTGWTPPPPAPMPTPSKAPAESRSQVAPQRRAPGGPAAMAPADCAEPGCGGGHNRACQQTSIQLALRATGTTAPTPIRIKKVELLDAKGASLGELTATSPTRWSTAGSYQAWDQSIAPGEQAAVSYVLSSPAWHSMEGGEWGQTGKMFQVRVTVLVGAKDRVIEKKAIQPTIMPPPMPT
jgi:hypothetical protein